jgi:glycosyltransferase involved in cell wall biosynthesis
MQPGSWECIVVDDGSTDDTDTIVRRIAARDERFRYVRQSNAGPAAARNTGIAIATGDWLAFMDSDDEYLPGALAVFSRTIDAHPSARVVCGGLAGTSRVDPVWRMTGRVAAHDAHAAMLGFSIAGPRVQLIALCVHRTVIDTCSTFAPQYTRSSEDREWLVRVTARYPVMFAYTFVARYNEGHGDGASDRSLVDGSKLVALRRMFSTMRSTDPDLVRLRDAHIAMVDAVESLRANQMAQARHQLDRALRGCHSRAERRALIVRLAYLITYPVTQPWSAAMRSARWLCMLGQPGAALGLCAWTVLVRARSQQRQTHEERSQRQSIVR